jgi:hypothetical protein
MEWRRCDPGAANLCDADLQFPLQHVRYSACVWLLSSTHTHCTSASAAELAACCRQAPSGCSAVPKRTALRPQLLSWQPAVGRHRRRPAAHGAYRPCGRGYRCNGDLGHGAAGGARRHRRGQARAQVRAGCKALTGHRADLRLAAECWLPRQSLCSAQPHTPALSASGLPTYHTPVTPCLQSRRTTSHPTSHLQHRVILTAPSHACVMPHGVQQT